MALKGIYFQLPSHMALGNLPKSNLHIDYMTQWCSFAGVLTFTSKNKIIYFCELGFTYYSLCTELSITNCVVSDYPTNKSDISITNYNKL